MLLEDLAEAKWLRRLIVAVLLAGLVLLAVQVLQPFVVPVIWAGILAYVTWPLHEKFVRALGGKRTLAALLMTLLLSAAIILPVVWFAVLIQTQAVPILRSIGPLLATVELPAVLRDLPLIGPRLQEILEHYVRDPSAVDEAVRAFFDRSSGELTTLLGGLGRNLAKLIIAMVSLFFMYRDGERFADQVRRMLERFFGGVRVQHYLEAIGGTVKAVVYGLVLAALAQATLAGLGYWVAGVPVPLLFAALTFLIGLIPFALPIMWVSVSGWLYLTGETVAAIGLFLWGLTAVSWIDNVVRPLVISGATRIPFLLVLFGVLGGLAAFGLVGLFIGPVILAVLMAIWREWIAEQRSQADTLP
jgi:predicted PurR-regulated permease PerM